METLDGGSEKHESPVAATEAYSASDAAYLGDAVFELCVREYLVKSAGDSDAANINEQAKRFVSAKAQAALMQLLIPHLTDEESFMYKKARNKGHRRTAKNINPVEYRVATGLEALFGYLYLEGKSERIRELFALIKDEAEKSSGTQDL